MSALKLWLVASASMMSTICAQAQETVAAPADDSATSGDEIVVTARKRGESLIDVPIAVSAVSGTTLDNYAIRDVQSAGRRIPNLYVDKSTAGPRIAIRGLGNPQTGGVVDSSVGLAIDGLFYGRPRWLSAGLFDVASLEVLRGPQSTYFGRNTTAGLVNITTRSPGTRVEGHVQGGYEFDIGSYALEAAVGGPVSDNFGIRVAYRYVEADGYIRNTAGTKDEPATRDHTARITLDWHPSDSFGATNKFSYFDSRENGNAQEIGVCGPVFIALLQAAGSNEDCRLNYVKSPNGAFAGGNNPKDFYTTNEGFSNVLTLAVTLGEHVLTSVTGYHDLKSDWNADGDWVASVLTFNVHRPERFKQFSQELRLQSPADQFLTYTLGLYYEDYSRAMNQNIDAGTFFGGDPFSVVRPLRVKAHSIAAFADVTWRLTPSLSVTGGGRFTSETRKGRLTQFAGPLGAPDFLGYDLRQTDKSKDFTPAITAQWNIGGSSQIYASYKEGFKGGGFDLDAGAPDGTFAYGDESAKSYEIGAKAELLDRKLLLTAAAFHTDVSDLQVQSYPGTEPTARIINAAAARLRGIELEARAQPIDGLRANASFAYTDAEYRDFQRAPCYLGQTPAQGCTPATPTDPSFQNLTGARLPLAPKYNGSVGLDWESNAFDGYRFQIGGQLSYRSSLFLNLEADPLTRARSLTLMDARIGLVPDGPEGWTVALVGNNIFDRKYVTGAVNLLTPGSFVYNLGRPRTIELQIGYRF